MTTRVALIEDNKTVRETLVLILNASPGLVCERAFANAEQALAEFPDDPPQVMLVDINLPGMSGIECVARLKERAPAMQILMLTIESEPSRVFQSLAAGAAGYLVKNVAPATLVAAIEEVQRGGSPMSSHIARLVVQAFQKEPSPPSNPPTPPETVRLTHRENEVLDLIARGFRTKEIAGSLGISDQTVQCHVRNIYEKLHVRSRVEAVSLFWQRSPRMSPGRPRA